MEIIYFEVNDWSAGRDFPDCEPFNTWLDIDNLTFRNKQWLIENNQMSIMKYLEDLVALSNLILKKI